MRCSVVRAHVSPLRRPRGGRFRVRRRGSAASRSRRPSFRELCEYNYFRRNVAGVQREWWYHRSGCRTWFQADRDTRTNEVAAGRPARASWRAVSRLPPQPGERDRPRDRRSRSRSTAAGGGARGRHDRLGAVRRRPAHVLAQLQVPPPPRADVLRRKLPQLPRRGRWRPGRARLHRAGPGGRAGRAPQRAARASSSTLMSVTDTLGGPFTPPGFYYKTFIRPRRLWPLYEWVLRHAAGLGRLPKTPGRADLADRVPPPARRRARRRRRPSRASAAAIAAAEQRRRRRARRRRPRARRPPAVGGRPRAGPRADRAGPREPASRCSTAAPALGHFDGLVAGLAGRHAAPDPRPPAHLRHRRDRAAARVRRQRPAGRDAVRRRAPAGGLYGVAPGKRAVVATTSDRGIRAALALQAMPASRSLPSPTCARRRRDAASAD